ncbi:class I SAM-dependent methyltransferase [Roseobacter sp. A03A-229]
MGRHQDIRPAPPENPTEGSYRLYFRSGHYDRRYPNPNLSTWQRILELLPQGGHVIDYGCGNGRYLLRLRERAGVAAGFDINAAALEMLAERAVEMGWTDLKVLGPDADALAAHVRSRGPADLMLCLFGVLAHIEAREDRLAVLRQMRRLLRKDTGRLLISVPNRRRRFRREQRQAGPGAKGLIRYTRVMQGAEVTLPYQLYDPDRLQEELAEAGFWIQSIRAESVLPESVLTTYPTMRWLDSWLTRVCPAALGYGLIAVAVP